MPGRHQVRDSMRNHPGFAASRTGQDQQRTFRAGYGVALLGGLDLSGNP